MVLSAGSRVLSNLLRYADVHRCHKGACDDRAHEETSRPYKSISNSISSLRFLPLTSIRQVQHRNEVERSGCDQIRTCGKSQRILSSDTHGHGQTTLLLTPIRPMSRSNVRGMVGVTPSFFTASASDASPEGDLYAGASSNSTTSVECLGSSFIVAINGGGGEEGRQWQMRLRVREKKERSRRSLTCANTCEQRQSETHFTELRA